MQKEKLNKGCCYLTVSLLCLVLLFAGCATKQDIRLVEREVNQVRVDQTVLKAKLDHMDSLVASGGERDIRVRADVRSSVEDLTEKFNQLQNQLNDLNQLINSIAQKTSIEPGQQQDVVRQTPDNIAQIPDTTMEMESSVDCTGLWDEAFKVMNRGQYDQALSGYLDYMEFCPRGKLLDNTQYWISECYYEMEMLDQAIEGYTKLINEYPESEKLSPAYFKLGRAYEEQGNQDKALENFLIIQQQYPGSVEYNQVKDKIERWQKTDNN